MYVDWHCFVYVFYKFTKDIFAIRHKQLTIKALKSEQISSNGSEKEYKSS